MTKYLNSALWGTINETRGNLISRRYNRLVGTDCCYDSGYFDIVRCFGERKIDFSSVPIRYQPELFSFTDPLLAEYAGIVERQMREEGRLHDGPTILKLKDIDWSASPGEMVVQECTYGTQAGSCFALDWPHPLFATCGGTLRDYVYARCSSGRVSDNPLAIGLGVCGVLVVGEAFEEFLLTVNRTARLASLESSVGPSAAGSVDTVLGYRSLEELALDAMAREIQEELNLAPDEYQLSTLAYARELFRGEKPQLFCLITTRLGRDELAERMRHIEEPRREFDAYQFVPLDREFRPDPDILSNWNFELKMNYYLAQEYWKQEKGQNRRA